MIHEIVKSIVDFFSIFPPALATVLMAMLPVFELRLALPVAVLGFDMHPMAALFWAVLGNMIPVTLILIFANKFHAFLEKRSHLSFSKTWVKQLAQAQEKFKKYEEYGLLGILIFVAVPLPFTGPWTGSLAAFLLGIPYQKSWPYVFGGVVLSGLLTLIVTVGVDKII